MNRTLKRAIGVVFALGALTSVARAQEALLPSTGWGLGWAFSAWYFADAIPQAGGPLRGVAQFSVPFRVRAGFRSWSVDLSGAGAYGAAAFLNESDESTSGSGDDGGEGRVVTIAGATDLKLRATGPIVGDNLMLTLGLNVPTGKTGLTGDETTALQAISAPALRMPIGSFGSGAGVTVGLIRAFEMGDWALALGGSAEQRTEYSAIALALSTGRSETRIAPGMALHATVGVDRPLGENRLSMLVLSDFFSKDELTISDDASAATNYQLGPQITAITRLEIASSKWRSSELNLSARLRSEFSDATGAKVSGSGGTYIEGSFGGILGGVGRTGLILGTDFRMHSGLEFTDALVGAATTAGGISIGFESPRERSVVRFVVHGQYGTFDTGSAKTTGMGVTLGVSVAARRDTR